MTNPSIFNQILIWPILNLLVGFYKLFLFLHFPGALGLAIISLTVFIRLLMAPLMAPQIKSAQKMQELKPKLDELSKKHKNDKLKLQQAQMQLYKEAGINPAAGCLPLFLQMPVFIALYQVFWQVLNNGNLEKIISEINRVIYFPFLKIESLNFSFFGLSLAHKPNEWQKIGWYLLLIPVITAGLQWWQTKMMAPNVQKTENKDEDMSQIMQQQMSFLFPLMIGWFAFSFPVGLALYWNTFTVLGIIQQQQIQNAKIKSQN